MNRLGRRIRKAHADMRKTINVWRIRRFVRNIVRLERVIHPRQIDLWTNTLRAFFHKETT